MAVGAYGFAISTLSFGVPFLVGLLIAVVSSVLFALILATFPPFACGPTTWPSSPSRRRKLSVMWSPPTSSTAVTGSANGLAAFEGGFYDMNPFPEGSYLGHEQP